MSDENVNGGEKKAKKTTRRGVLRSGVYSVGGVGLLSVFGSTGLPSEQVSPVMVKGEYGNPLSKDEVKKAARRQLEKFEDLRGLGLEKRSFSTLNSGTGELVGYAAGITDSGTLKQEFVLAQDEESVPKAHKRVGQAKKEIAQEVQMSSLSEGVVSAAESDWNIIEESRISTTSYYGSLFDDYVWKQSQDNFDVFGYNERFYMEPEPGNSSLNKKGLLQMDWSDSSPEMNLDKWEPFGGTEGTVSKDFTMELSSDPNISYTFGYSTSETDVNDDTTTSSGIVDWDMDFNSSDARTTTAGFDSGTLGELVSGSPDGALFEIESEGKFAASYDYNLVLDTLSQSRSFLPY